MTLRDAIDKDFFYIENISYSDDDIRAMSFDELETLKMQITKKIDGLSLSLKEKQAENSNGLEKDWSMSRKRALYINQRVQTYVASIMRKHKERKATVQEHFVDRAQEILPPAIFQEILYKAQKSLREGKL